MRRHARYPARSRGGQVHLLGQGYKGRLIPKSSASNTPPQPHSATTMFKFFLAALAVSAPLAVNALTCADGQSQASVEGAVDDYYCVDGTDVCMGERADGACPGVQEGLPYGSFCGVVDSGVYGCKMHTQATMLTSGVGATAPLVPGPFRCGDGLSAMSVEGVDLVFCVLEPACAADVVDGNCPGAQPGLPFGAYCDTVRTSVSGCKPYNGTDIRSDVVYPPVRSCGGNEAGETPVSVEGLDTFCAAEPVCSGVNKGNCPRIQDGLARDSMCAMIKTGVYGCVVPA